MAHIGVLVVCGRCFNSSCHLHQSRYPFRSLITLTLLLLLLTYALLCTWRWQILLPVPVASTAWGFPNNWTLLDIKHLSNRASSRLTEPPRRCDVLESMTRGSWKPRPHSALEMDRLAQFIRMSRAQHNLPPSLERPDGLCGNVTFAHLAGKMHNLLWFRALCDPAGPRPCCYHNRCTSNIPVNDCRCQDCYDMRQPIHAEFATWVPSDPICKMRMFQNVSGACDVLRNSTVVMIGDSFMRHVYTAVLSLLRSEVPYGPRRWNTSSVLLKVCREDFIYQQSCAATLDRNTRECGNTTKIKFFEYIAARQTHTILETIRQLWGIPNSYVLLGIGIHDDFNFNRIAQLLLHPLLTFMKTFRWPEVIWMSTHAPGLLKTPRVPSQSAKSILQYNTRVKSLLQTNTSRVPILDFYQLTNDVMSFDGAHYGRGVNEVKAQIFLNYIQGRRSSRVNQKAPS